MKMKTRSSSVGIRIPPPPTQGSNTHEIYYWAAKGKYMLQNARGDWMLGTRQDAVDCLIECGFSRVTAVESGLSPIDRELLRIRRTQAVDFASSLAGYRRGYYPDLNGRTVLVTDGPKVVAPVPGDWKLVKQIIHGLLADADHDQVAYFHGWMAEVCKSLSNGQWRPGQVLGLIGPSCGGKGLLQSIITKVTGGRESDPSLYLSRRTDFNAELFGSEHLRISDEIVVRSATAVRQFGNGLKQIAANRTHKLHDKRSRGIDLPVFWRCTMSLNDNPADLALLPDMEDAMADKFLLFKCAAAPLPMPTETVDQELALWNALASQVPHYVYWLLNKFKLPQALRSRRFGVKHFHHPDIIARLRGRSPEDQVLSLIDSVGIDMFEDGTRAWTGTTGELQAVLRHAVLADASAKALLVNRCFSDHLRKAAMKFATRIKEARNARSGISWIVFPAWQQAIKRRDL